MHGEILDELLKLFAARDEISFAVYLDEHADFATHVDVRTDDAFCGDAAFFLFRGRQSALAQNFDCALFASICFGQRLFAFHHSGACFFAQRFNVRCVDLCHDCLCLLTSGTDFSLCSFAVTSTGRNLCYS